MTDFQENIMAGAIDYMIAHHAENPDLDFLAAKFGYESTHFQKIFKEKVGISPKRLMQYMTYTRAREFLLEGYPTLEAAHQAGLSGGGRLHDLFVACEAVTPGIVQRRGEGMEIRYGYHDTPFGELLIGCSGVGVCWAGFAGGDRDAALTRMRDHWPQASIIAAQDDTREIADSMLAIWRGQGNAGRKMTLHLHGTNFQIQVWRALLRIPAGGTISYGDLAGALGDPKASRAVGTAVGRNPIALLIPCHRVIQGSGIVENYAWGTARKKAILALESEVWNVPEGLLKNIS